MCPGSETVILKQKRLRDKVDIGSIEGDRGSVVDLNRVSAKGGSNGPVDLHVGTFERINHVCIR